MSAYHLSIDLETFSSVDIKRAGLYRYAQSPDFEILLLAYAWGGESPHIIDLTGSYDAAELNLLRQALQDSQVTKHAYNAAFEWFCFNRAGFATPLEQWRCTMLHGLYCGYPAGLGEVGKAIGLPEDKRKLGTGMSLIRTFCVPCKPTKNNGHRTRTLPTHEPEKWLLFRQYCMQDVAAEMEIARRLANFPVPDDVQRQWVIDQQINTYGAAVDTQLVDSALHCSQVSVDALTAEAQRISGLPNPNSNKQLLEWLREAVEADDPDDDDPDDEPVPDVTKATVARLLGETTDDTIRRMLEIRQDLAKTSITKYAAMRDAMGNDGRVRGLIQNYKANRTGRAAGRLVQVQNLPKNHLPALEYARECALHRKMDHLRVIFGGVPDTLSQLIRTAFIPSPGNRLVVADFSAIEARVIAWLAGEEWRTQVFATHGRIYEASASAMFGVPIEEITKGSDLRQRGKVAELALGYQGGEGALKKMDKDKNLQEDELKDIVERWRAANKQIVGLWYALNEAAVSVVETARPAAVRGLLTLMRESDPYNDYLTIQLPSGRKLYYARPAIVPNKWNRASVQYWGVEQKKGKWASLGTYGGKLAENVTQAIARDCLYAALERIYAADYRVLFHVHDEVVLDVPGDADAVLADVLRMMREPIPWAPGLLLNADGFVCDYYQKD